MKQFEKTTRTSGFNARWIGAVTLVGATGVLGALAQAQNTGAVNPQAATPAVGAPAQGAAVPGGNNAAGNNARREERQRQRQLERQQQMQALQNMTPEERQKAMQERRSSGLRRQIENAGVTDKAAQDSIIEYLQAEETARGDLREAATKLQQGLRSNAITDTQVSVLLNEFRDAVDAEKSRRASAAKALDAKVGYSKNPRLEAMLTMMGAIGDESSYLSPMGAGGGRGAMAGGPGAFGAGGFGAGAFGQGQGRGQNARGQNARGNRNRQGQNGQAMNTTPANPAP